MERQKSKLVFACMLILLLGGVSVAVNIQADDCADAPLVGDVRNLEFDTRGTTLDGLGHFIQGPNIWYRYVASCTGDVTVSLMGSDFDTLLAVYSGGGCYPAFVDLIASNDNFNLRLQSQVTFPAMSGDEFLIEIGGNNSAVEEGVLTITCDGEPGPAPSNDDCSKAKPVGNVNDLPFDTKDMTFDGQGLCMTSPNIWYCYTASCTGEVTVSLSGSAFDTMLAVYKGCECYPAQKDLIECNDDFGSAFQSQVTFAAVAGNQYLIEIGGYGSETGQGVLNIICEDKPTAIKPDLGDAPDSTNNSGNKTMDAYPFPFSVPAHFPTVYNDVIGFAPYAHGPLHLNERAVAYLGKSITGETEADTGPDDDGINNLRPLVNSADNDGGDDGVSVPLTLPNCGWTIFDYQVTVIDSNTDLWVNVWLDFNRDGDWDDTVDCPGGRAPEWAVQNQFLFNLPVGLNEIITPGFKSVHPAAAHEKIWMRITLSEQPWIGGSNPGHQGNAGSGPVAKYEIGETEDYFFLPEVPGDGGADCPLCEDVNGDGVINMNDLADLTAKWLASCL